MARCTDLKFKKDFSSGRWYDDKGLLVWNTAIDSVAFVGTYPFKEKLELIFTPDVRIVDIEFRAKINWADHQPGLLLNCLNDNIEPRIEQVCNMVESLGFDMSMAKINEPITDLGDSPARDDTIA
eukprot:6209022-Prymnesium_polylepis.2